MFIDKYRMYVHSFKFSPNSEHAQKIVCILKKSAFNVQKLSKNMALHVFLVF